VVFFCNATDKPGKSILKAFNGADATDHFYSLHSKEAIGKLKRMRPMETKEAVPKTEAIDACTC